MPEQTWAEIYSFFIFKLVCYRKLKFCHKLKVSNHYILQSDGVNLRYFELRLFDLTIQILKDQGALHQVATINELEKLKL